MKENLINIGSYAVVGFCVLSFGMVSLMAFINPQSVMDLVQTPLPTKDAYSSIRGMYGGVNAVIVFSLIYLFITDRTKSLVLVGLLAGMYAICRVLSMMMEGMPGAFATNWLFIEATVSVIAWVIVAVKVRSER